MLEVNFWPFLQEKKLKLLEDINCVIDTLNVYSTYTLILMVLATMSKTTDKVMTGLSIGKVIHYRLLACSVRHNSCRHKFKN